MDFVTDFHFLRPWWFLSLVPAIALLGGLWLSQRKSSQWSRVIASDFLPYLLDGRQIRQRRWPLLCLLALWFLASISLAGPTWEKIPQPVEQKASSLVICWDLSPSMLAADVKPSRLVRSRLKLIDLLKTRKEGQTALIAFSAEAYTVTPLTDDTQTIINLLPALSPTTLPSVGSNPEMAFEQAEKLLRDAGAAKGHIVMITDEIPSDALDFMSNPVKRSPYQLTLWPVGTTEGAPISLPNGGFLKDSSGNIAVAKLNENELMRFAADHQSYYVPMVIDDNDIQTLAMFFEEEPSDTLVSHQKFDQWFEHGQYLTLLFLPFVALLFRRGFIFSLLISTGLLTTLSSPSARAISWDDLWLTQDQQAQLKLEEGDDSAAAEFTSPERRGSAYYQQEDYQQAAKEFAQGKEATDAYNLGTTLTKAGQFEQAINAFDQALAKQPGLEAAEHNRAIAKELLEMQKQQEQEQQQQQSQDGQNSDQQQGDSQEGENSESSQDQQGEQNSSQSQNGDSDDSQQQSQAQESEEDAENPEQANPYQQAREEEAQKAQQDQEALAENEDEPENSEQEQQGKDKAMATLPMPQGQTEEEQMLEQMLRKVPDDPSGLLRNKFKYQYYQRRQSLDSQFSNKEAEERL